MVTIRQILNGYLVTIHGVEDEPIEGGRELFLLNRAALMAHLARHFGFDVVSRESVLLLLARQDSDAIAKMPVMALNERDDVGKPARSRLER